MKVESQPGHPNTWEILVLPILALLLNGVLVSGLVAQPVGLRTDEKNLSLHRKKNPPMVVLTYTPPKPDPNPEDFPMRNGFKLIDSLDELRKAIKQDNQKIRLKPGVYRAEKVDPPKGDLEHVFAVTGSNNHFDFRGAVIETPASTLNKLTRQAHKPHTWHIFGEGNTFEGGYYRNVLDKKYHNFYTSDNEFSVSADNTTFRGGTFVIKGSFPYGYQDFYGKGGKSWTGLNKHSFMSVGSVDNFQIINCEVYQQSFGHGVHLHGTNSALIKGCELYGTVRPTNDIIEPGKAVPKGLGEFTEKNIYSPPGRYETVGPAKKHDYQIMYRGARPIPPNEMIPLPEDGIRSYNNVEDVVVKDTLIERYRHCVTLQGPGDYLIDNVTVREAGHISYQVGSKKGTVMIRDSGGDLPYDPLLDLTTRAPTPSDDFYELDVLGARDPRAEQTVRSTEVDAPKSVGSIKGNNTTFVFRSRKARELPDQFNYIRVGDNGLNDSTVINYTTAEVRLNDKASDTSIYSAGPVKGTSGDNTVQRLAGEVRFQAVLDGLDVATDAKVREFPSKGDVDGDGVANGSERQPFFDTDRDGRVNIVDPDSDGDNLNDGRERKAKTNPLKSDTDEDKLSDGYEVRIGSDPRDPQDPGYVNRDRDQDGLTMLEEQEHGTQPDAKDTDQDELKDGAEVNEHGTDPTRRDTDDDGVDDATELKAGTDPTDPLSKPEMQNLALLANQNGNTGDFGGISDARAHDIDGAFTVSAWVKTNDQQGIILKRRITRADLRRSLQSQEGLSKHKTATAWPGTIDAYTLRVNEGQVIAEYTNSYNKTRSVKGGPSISDGRWHHVAAVLYTGPVSVKRPPVRAFTLYVDGRGIKEKRVSGNPMVGNGEIRILNGWGDGPEFSLSGMVDEVRIYNRALRPFQIRSIGRVRTASGQRRTLSGPIHGDETGLIIGFRFDDGQSRARGERRGAADLAAEPNDFSRAMKLNGEAQLVPAPKLPVRSSK